MMMLLKMSTSSYSNSNNNAVSDGAKSIVPGVHHAVYCSINKPTNGPKDGTELGLSNDDSIDMPAKCVGGQQAKFSPPEIPDVVALSSGESTPCSSPIINSQQNLMTALTISTRCNGNAANAKPSGIYSPSRRLNGVTPVDRIDEDVDSPIVQDEKIMEEVKMTSNDDEELLVDNEPSSNSRNNSCDRMRSPETCNFSSSNENDSRSPFRDRRQTIASKFPLRKHSKYVDDYPRKSSLADECWWIRKQSANEAGLNNNDSDDISQQPRQLSGYRRRMSVPEKSLFNADYAILRKNFESQIEIVGAFHRADSDAYRNFLDSLTCYDLAPQHGVVIMLDARLTLHKAVTILCLNAGNRAALINNAANRRIVYNTGIFTVTDCLHVLKVAAQQAKSNETPGEKFADKTLQHFLDEIQQKSTIISATSTTSIWNVARLFRMNRVHRIPVLEENISVNIQSGQLRTTHSTEVISFISLKMIFVEILKLCNSKCALKPNFHMLAVKMMDVGEWSKIATILEDDTFGKAIDTLLERKISCLPILRGESGKFIGVLTKDDILDVVAQCGPQSYAEVLEAPIKSLMRNENDIPAYATPETSIETAIRLILNDTKSRMAAANIYRQERQCIYVVDEKTMRLVGVVSLADIMQFIFASTNTSSSTQGVPPYLAGDDEDND